jgi:hypothetical protein
MRGRHLDFAWLCFFLWALVGLVLNILGLLDFFSLGEAWAWIGVVSLCTWPPLLLAFHLAGVVDKPPGGWRGFGPPREKPPSQ